MAISIRVNVENHATEALGKLADALEPNALATSMGEAGVILFQNHFRNATPNKHGCPITGYWPAAAEVIRYTVAGGAGVTIQVDQPGGNLAPIGGRKHPAIPNRTETFALAEAAATQITPGNKSSAAGRGYHTTSAPGGVVFSLVNSVNQLPNPNLIPDLRDIAAVAKQTVADLVVREGGAQ